ncbi:MAG: hypothetical protein WKF79_09615 [Nocardioides sp.]
MYDALIEARARQQIAERVARASQPHLPNHRRHQLATRLRRAADRLEG